MVVTKAAPMVIHGFGSPRAYKKIINPKVIKKNPTEVKKDAYRKRAIIVKRA